MFISAALTMGLWLVTASAETPLVVVPDPRAALQPESAAERTARHARVAKARTGTAVVLHRAAWQYAPENTLSGIRAAAELRAAGVELDFHRTLDGVIVLFHDDSLERLLDGIGRVDEYYYEELLLYTFNGLPAPAAETERVPAFRDLLQILRSRALFVHLDIKVPGIDREMLEELQKADMLDQVAGYSDYNSPAFRGIKLATVSWKGSLMGHDTDPQEARAVLKHPGNMLMMDDPRATLVAMGKPPVRIAPRPWAPLAEAAPPSLAALEAVLRGTTNQLPARLAAVRMAIYAPQRFTEIAGELCRSSSAEIRRATAWNLGMIAKHRPALVSETVRDALLLLLGDADASVRAEAAVACGRARVPAAVPALVKLLADRPADYEQWTEDKDRLAERRTMIEARAHAAFGLGLLGAKSPAVTQALVEAVKHRGAHADRMLAGSDAVAAASALGRLHAAETAGALREVMFQGTPAMAEFSRSAKRAAQPAQHFKSLDARTQAAVISDMRTCCAIVPALAEMGGDEAWAVLNAVIDGPGNEPETIQAYLCSLAAESMMTFPGADRVPMCARLLAHRQPAVRRAAIFACLKKSDPQYRKLLEGAAAWAIPWWDVQHSAPPR